MNTENNKKIALFMGNEPIPNTDTIVCKSGQRMHISDFNYDSDWLELMPVVGKIESMGHTVDIYNNVCIIPGLSKQIAETKIAAVYAACVAFLNWYNNQSEQTI